MAKQCKVTEKQFTYLNASKNHYIGSFFYNGVSLTNEEVVDLLNENEQLKQKVKDFQKDARELRIYRKVANCHNCAYHSYDWFDDGDEFEICEKGNNEQQMDYHICEDWREL